MGKTRQSMLKERTFFKLFFHEASGYKRDTTSPNDRIDSQT